MAQPELASDSERLSKLAKEHADLQPLLITYQQYQELHKELLDAQQMAGGDDPGLVTLAREEVARLRQELPSLEQQIKTALVPRDPKDDKNVIMEVRAGTGGDEAALFAADLYRAYLRYAQRKGWRGGPHQHQRERHQRAQGGGLRGPGTRRLPPPEARERCSPGAASAGDRGPGAHPHLHGHGCRAARSGGGGHSDQTRGPAHRHLPRRGRRRPEREQGGHRRADHSPTLGHSGRVPGRALPAPQQEQGDGGGPLPSARARDPPAAAGGRAAPAAPRWELASGQRRCAPTISPRTG